MGRKNHKKKQQQRRQHQGSTSQVVKGTLELTRSGMGYVLVDQLENDIMVRPSDLQTALHGDLVKVAIKERKSNGRMQGVVKEVIKRKRSEFIGQLQMGNGFAFFVAETDKPMPDIFIPKQLLQGAGQGDRVVAKVIKWADGDDKRPMGEVVTILKEEDMNDAAMKEILLEAGFPLSFSDEVIEESARLPEQISQDEIARRKDCRDILTFTIDPVDAKDFDDAISFRKLPSGWFEIGVHIADVSHYVEPQTALDAEAYARATSVYLPDRVNPMLPENISNVLCSLRPREEKLTFSTLFTITPQGEIKEQWIGRTVIYSDHRFTYEEVQAIIEEEAGLYAEEILTLNRLAKIFRQQRFNQGAINFSSQEVRFKLNE